MATALSAYANATVTFPVPTGSLSEDPETGNFEPDYVDRSIRAFLKFGAIHEMMMVGSVQVEGVFKGRAVELIPEGVIEAQECKVLLDGDDTVWSGIVRNLRAPFGRQGIGALVTPLAGEAMEIYCWRQI